MMVALSGRYALPLMWLCILVRGDDFDDHVDSKRRELNIGGLGIAFYDSSTMSEPVIRGYGRIASSSSSPLVTADTTFMIASISKVFTSSAVAVLVDQGIIDLDDDICNVLPSSWENQSACRNPKYPSQKITWKMISTHRSSFKGNVPGTQNSKGDFVLPGYGPSGGYLSSEPAAGNPTCPLRDVVGFYRDILTDKPTETSVGADMTVKGGGKLDWYKLAQSKGGLWKEYEPGAQQSYSNFGAGYLAALIELLTGQAFDSFCNEHLFEPLGMTNTAWFREDLPLGTLEAIPVEYNKNNKSYKDVGHYCFIDYASGELRTSARDLATWSEAMLHKGAPELWSEAIGETVVSCQEEDQNGNQVSNCEFALGWVHLNNGMKSKSSTESWLRNSFKQYDWTQGIMHDGAEAGSQTQLLVLPNAGVYAVVLTNTDRNDGWAAQKMAAALVEAPLPEGATGPPPAPAVSPNVSPITAPVASPTTTSPVQAPVEVPPGTGKVCEDSDGQVFWVNSRQGYKSCKWLRNKKKWKKKLCKLNNGDASYYCRETCNSCSYWNGNDSHNPEIKLSGPIPAPNQCINADGLFWVKKLSVYQTCTWLANDASKSVRRSICSWNTPGDYVCQKMCGSCKDWN
jgi:CubicO group peptidase (beta-lactamase class C family)/ribosomal protein L24E